MPILNYTTGVGVLKTAGEIQGLLVSKGAKSINMDFENGEPIAIWFKIEMGASEMSFRLPCNWKNVEKVMNRDPKCPPRFKNSEQAKRVAWRIVKDWVEAQLAIIESGQVEMAEAFFPYVMIPGLHQTLFQHVKERPRLLLGAGDPDAEQDNVIDGGFQKTG